MLHTTAYATPDDVAELIGYLDPITMEPKKFDNVTYPTYNLIQRRLLAYSDEFDARTHDTWRLNQISNQIFNRGTLWQLDNMAYYGAPYMKGGWMSQLLSPIAEWDPSQGDKLEYRSYSNTWIDITDKVNGLFWFDYQGGMFFTNLSAIPVDNAFRITYRYGKNEEPPYDVQDAVAKMTAIYIMQSDWYRTKIAGGGDLSSKNETVRQWRDEVNQVIYAHMNAGEAYSLLP